MQKYQMAIDGRCANPASGLGRENGVDAMRDYLRLNSIRIDAGAATAAPFVAR